MIKTIRDFWTASIRRQLILGIALVHAAMMSFFVFDLVEKERKFLTKQHEKKTQSLARTLASNATSWVLANDFIGLQEVIGSLEHYPGIKYIMVLDIQGQVLAHSDKKFIGKYITDTKSVKILKGGIKTISLFENSDFIDVMSPILRDKQHIGWARIALDKEDINRGLYNVTLDGVLYTLFAVLIGIVFAYFMAVGITKGIYKIIDTIKRAKNGEKSVQSNLDRKDEIGLLSKEFDNIFQELLDKNSLITSVINSTPDLIFYKDYDNFDGIYIGCNEAFSKFVGKPIGEIIGKKDCEIFDHEIAEFFREKDKEMLRSKQSQRNEEWIKYPDGKKVLVDTLKTPLYNFDKSILGVIGLSRDITKDYNNRQEIEKKNTLLFQQAKLAEMGEMLSNIAHQWRQPLSVISTASTGLLMEHEMGILEDQKLKKNLNLIYDNTQYLSSIIDTFRDYIKEKKEYKEVVIQERIHLALNIIKASLDNHYINLVHNLDEIEPIKIKLVIGELSEVIINIVNNAKDALIEKNIENPWVQLLVEKQKEKVLISIEDNAGGIPENLQTKIFEPYFTTKHQSVGTGLGLHMSNKIITESLNGKLYVKNTTNGAKFFIELPLTT